MSKYKVGRGKPPKKTRFKKGSSGNPKGRPKGSLNVSTILQRQSAKPVVIQENGKQKRVSKSEAVIMRLLADALNGKPQAMGKALNLLEAMGQSGERQFRTTDFDRDIIRRFAPRIIEEMNNDDLRK